MSKPIVSVIGRPNVGKSTLFNILVGDRLAIVEDTPGVTRDRLIAEAEWQNQSFNVIDTGGIEPYKKEPILKQMRLQAEIAIDMSDVILFLVDGREGLTATDQEVASMIRKQNKPVILAVNKLDSINQEEALYEFYNLGLGDPIPISAEQRLGLGDLLDLIVSNFNKETLITEEDEEDIKVAVVGKPNAGKSTLINKLLGEDRLIVSDIPGTTRDAVDSTVNYNDIDYTFIDTAGIRKKKKIYENIEKYSILRAVTAVERSDVVILLIDGDKGVSEQDQKIASIIQNRYKPCLIVVNKWDIVTKDSKTMSRMKKDIKAHLNFLDYAPILFISAKTGRNIKELFKEIDFVYKQARKRISTGKLNEALLDIVAVKQPPSKSGRRLKIYYASQVSVNPPTFVLFVNDPKIMHFSYLRYLENSFREIFDFDGTPIRIFLRDARESRRSLK